MEGFTHAVEEVVLPRDAKVAHESLHVIQHAELPQLELGVVLVDEHLIKRFRPAATRSDKSLTHNAGSMECTDLGFRAAMMKSHLGPQKACDNMAKGRPRRHTDPHSRCHEP